MQFFQSAFACFQYSASSSQICPPLTIFMVILGQATIANLRNSIMAVLVWVDMAISMVNIGVYAKKRKKIIMFIMATNMVASRPPEHQPTGRPQARAKRKSADSNKTCQKETQGSKPKCPHNCHEEKQYNEKCLSMGIYFLLAE